MKGWLDGVRLERHISRHSMDCASAVVGFFYNSKGKITSGTCPNPLGFTSSIIIAKSTPDHNSAYTGRGGDQHENRKVRIQCKSQAGHN